MKKILLGLTLLASFSAFADTSCESLVGDYECRQPFTNGQTSNFSIIKNGDDYFYRSESSDLVDDIPINGPEQFIEDDNSTYSHSCYKGQYQRNISQQDETSATMELLLEGSRWIQKVEVRTKGYSKAFNYIEHCEKV